jgi:hypothetical protein
MEKVSECRIIKTLILKNPYAACEVENDIIRNDVKTNTVSETIHVMLTVSKETTSITPVGYCTSTKEPVEEPKEKIETQHNLQNPKKTQLKWFAKEDNEIIPFQ